MRPEGQVTLCCERRGRIHTIDFLVVNVPDGNVDVQSLTCDSTLLVISFSVHNKVPES